jgi:hypothetical protein
MKTRTALITVVILVFIAAVVYMVAPGTPASVNNPENEMPTTTAQEKTYSNAKYGISFQYPYTYELSVRLGEGSAERERYSITLIRKEDLPPPQGGEGPPAITIEIFQNNLDNQTTEGWIRNSSFSNYKLSSNEGILASTTVDGEPALSYRWSGLYEGTTIAVAQQDWVYAFSVTYLEMGADIIQDFVQIMKTVKLAE